jgi:uncharacterized protein (TIGR00369 family)
MLNGLEDVRRLFEEGIPFNRYLGMKVAEVRAGFVRLELPFRPEFIGDTRRPALHGGILSTLIDTAGGAATFSRCSTEDAISTIDLRVDYLRPGSPELLVVEATVVRIGNRVSVTDARAFHPSDPSVTVATGKAVYNVQRRKSPG